MKKIVLISTLLLAVVAGFSQDNKSIVQLVNPQGVAAPRGYSQAAIIDLGNCTMVIMSGQVALDKDGNLAGKDDIGKQTEQVFTNIKNIVESAGGSMKDVIKLGYFTTDVSQLQNIRNARDKFIDIQHPPASTLVQVSRLFREDILIEIEATAIIAKSLKEKRDQKRRG